MRWPGRALPSGALGLAADLLGRGPDRLGVAQVAVQDGLALDRAERLVQLVDERHARWGC